MKKVLMRFPLTSKARRVPRAHTAADHWCAELSPAALHLILRSGSRRKAEPLDDTSGDTLTTEITLAEVDTFMAQGCPGIPRVSCPTCPFIVQKET
jgi:hypothetical protein